MTDQTQRIPTQPDVSVEEITNAFSQADLNDLCDATDAAIEGGGGFGWVNIPARETLERYWQGVIAAPTRKLFVARLDSVICGTTQIILPPRNSEAQGHMVTLTTNFIAPWARGHGLAKMLLEDVERCCLEDGYSVINLDVRDHMSAAIQLYESMGYKQFGVHPHAVCINGEFTTSRFYTKLIKS